MATLDDIARSTVARHGMLPEGASVVALVSGGADSIAMLRLLAAGALDDVSGRLTVLHVNHMLRGADADEDAAFVESVCASLEVPCRVVRYDVAAYAAGEGLNLEDAGRRVRYRFASDELERLDAGSRGRIATAHTKDDDLETFLMRLVTGSGAAGLRGIAPVRGSVVRPLIEARRADVVAYLQSLGQSWRTDATNEDTTRLRGWVRHELLPLVESQNPAFEDTAARTMRVLAEEDDLLSELADAFARDFTRVEDGVLVFERPLMSTLSRPMARRTIREALSRAFPEASRIEFEHTEAVADGIADERFARDLPYGLRAATEYDTLRISRGPDTERVLEPGLLECPGDVAFPGTGTLSARHVEGREVAAGPDVVSIDADAVRWPLVVDSARAGDRVRPLGLGGSKKLSDLFVDAKVPKRDRRNVPIVRDGDRIVWVAGLQLGDESKVTATTSRIARLEWRRDGQ